MIEHRRCFRDPIPEIYESAELLNKALIFHLKNETRKTKELLLKADIPVIRDWTESIWGAKSLYIKIRQVNNPKPRLKKNERIETRKKLNWFARFTLSLIIACTFLILLYLLFFTTLMDEHRDLVNILVGAYVAVLAKSTDYWFKDKEDAEDKEAQQLHNSNGDNNV